MKRRSATISVALIAPALVAGCVGEARSPAAESGLDCSTIEWVVPYEPGGGSDQQMRRLKPHLEDELGLKINPVYRTGGAGAVGWQSVADADPDGCTVGTAVYPDMALLTLGLHRADEGYRMQDFTYLDWTEAAPNALYVAADSEYDDLKQLIDAAKSEPGGLTFGGSGDAARLVFNQIEQATGMNLTYVPFEGGVGEIVPALLGGHVDMGVGGAHHVVEAYADTTRALAVAGSDRVPALQGVPTFAELGHRGVTVATVWGVLAPPDMPDEISEAWNEALVAAVDKVAPEFDDKGLTAMSFTPEKSKEYVLKEFEALQKVVKPKK